MFNFLPMVFQREIADCGVACLTMVAGYYGLNVKHSFLRKHFDTNIRGFNVDQMMESLATLNISSRLVGVEPEDLKNLEMPAILHWDLGHFVVLKSVSRKEIVIHDPNIGPCKIPLKDVGKHLSGYAIECLPTAEFVPESFSTKRKISDLWSEIRGVYGASTAAILLSFGMLVGILITPFFLKYAVDEISYTSNTDILIMLAIVFAFTSILTALLRYARDLVMLYVGNRISLQIGSNLFNHLMNLPLNFFEKRNVGDINVKFNAIERVREAMTDGLLVLIMDGFLAVAAIIVLCMYSPLLASVSIAAMLLYSLIRYLSHNKIRQYHDGFLIAQGAEQSNFLETLRGVQAIKLFGRETERFSMWQNSYKETMQKRQKIGGFESAIRSVNDLVYSLEYIVMVSLGVFLVIQNQITIGLLFVAISYKNIFSDRIRMCIDKIVEFRLLSVFLDHVGDIVDQGIERTHPKQELLTPEGKSVFTANNISFRYQKDHDWIFKNVNFEIMQGESIAFIGRSGEGKSTLIKLLLGLISPTNGDIYHYQQNFKDINLKAMRNRIGVVMQNDSLLSGSIMDNITFFDSQPNREFAYKCAEAAMIMDDIASMPMGFDSLIGDMGSTLSGGQKQRLMISRCLYRNPSVIILDEGTANLDIETEAKLLARLKRFGATVISVAHRPETVKYSNRIFSLNNGMLKEVSIVSLEEIRDRVFDDEVLRSA